MHAVITQETHLTNVHQNISKYLANSSWAQIPLKKRNVSKLVQNLLNYSVNGHPTYRRTDMDPSTSLLNIFAHHIGRLLFYVT